MTDPINPDHYRRFPVEVIEITEHLTYNLGSAAKYITRAGYKDPDKLVEDLRKAVWYLEREIMRVGKEVGK